MYRTILIIFVLQIKPKCFELSWRHRNIPKLHYTSLYVTLQCTSYLGRVCYEIVQISRTKASPDIGKLKNISKNVGKIAKNYFLKLHWKFLQIFLRFNKWVSFTYGYSVQEISLYSKRWHIYFQLIWRINCWEIHRNFS